MSLKLLCCTDMFNPSSKELLYCMGHGRPGHVVSFVTQRFLAFLYNHIYPTDLIQVIKSKERKLHPTPGWSMDAITIIMLMYVNHSSLLYLYMYI